MPSNEGINETAFSLGIYQTGTTVFKTLADSLFHVPKSIKLVQLFILVNQFRYSAFIFYETYSHFASVLLCHNGAMCLSFHSSTFFLVLQSLFPNLCLHKVFTRIALRAASVKSAHEAVAGKLVLKF